VERKAVIFKEGNFYERVIVHELDCAEQKDEKEEVTAAVVLEERVPDHQRLLFLKTL
jgi:hypothetical protein